MPPRDSRFTTVAIGVLALLVVGAAGLELPYGLVVGTVGSTAIILLLANVFIWKISIFPYDRILSAVADAEGLKWTREEGIRLDVGDIHGSCQVYYPEVVELDGEGYRLYYRAGGPDAFIASAYSADGLAWREEEGIRIDRGGPYGFRRVESCDVLRWGDAGWRMYFSAFDGKSWCIYRCHSADGLEWRDAALCIDATADADLPDVKAPTLVREEFGWRMFYMRFSQQRIEFYTSFSADGDHWEEGELCSGISSGDSVARNPHVRRLEDGSLRVYFSERASGDHTALGACVCSARSTDGIHWQREPGTRIAPGRGYDRHGIFSVDFLPTAAGLRMYYTGYWGRHWLEPLTRLQYRKNSRI